MLRKSEEGKDGCDSQDARLARHAFDTDVKRRKEEEHGV